MARKGDGIRKRGDSWWLDFTHESKRHQVRLGRNINRTAAKEIADVQRARILRGDVGIARKKKDIKFEDATELFMESARTEKRPSTIYFYESCFARLGELFHGKRLSQITEFALERHKQRRFKQGAPTRVNKELKSLSTLYRRMIEWKRYEGPIPKTKLLPEPKGRLRFLSEDEESRLLDTSKEPHRTIWVTGIHGGLRVRSESLTLRWGSVDFVGDLLHVESGFAKKQRSSTRSDEFHSSGSATRSPQALEEHRGRRLRFHQSQGQTVPMHPHRFHWLPHACRPGGRCGAACAPPHVRESPCSSWSPPSSNPALGRVEEPSDGRALHAPESGTFGRCCGENRREKNQNRNNSTTLFTTRQEGLEVIPFSVTTYKPKTMDS